MVLTSSLLLISKDRDKEWEVDNSRGDKLKEANVKNDNERVYNRVKLKDRETNKKTKPTKVVNKTQ